MEEFIKQNILDTVSKKYQYDPESLDYLMNIKGQLLNVIKTVDETIDYMVSIKNIKNKRNGIVYPFDEGDDYWTIEDGKVVASCWDYVSEDMYAENPDTEYFMSEESAINHLNKTKL